MDHKPQPKYPFEFVQADALTFIREHGLEFDVIHTSPPCQGYSRAGDIWGNYHPKLIAKTRLVLLELGHPLWVIENVPAAQKELYRPLELCGTQFGLKLYRHRYFECNQPLRRLSHPEHKAITLQTVNDAIFCWDYIVQCYGVQTPQAREPSA